MIRTTCSLFLGSHPLMSNLGGRHDLMFHFLRSQLYKFKKRIQSAKQDNYDWCKSQGKTEDNDNDSECD